MIDLVYSRHDHERRSADPARTRVIRGLRMDRRPVGIVLNGVTGRMGYRQHLVRSLLAIRSDGGLPSAGGLLWPEPVLVGRDEAKLAEIAERHGLSDWTT